MILGVGIDSVEIDRFAQWHTYNHKQLLRIFSDTEIEYCLSVPAKSAERFAVRFAAREALFKAYSSWQPDHRIPFLTFCRAISIIKKNNVPFITINWHLLEAYSIDNRSAIKIHLSLTHSHNSANVFTIIEIVT